MSTVRHDHTDEKSDVAPPYAASGRGRVVVCPFCQSTETELLSLFGSQLSTTQYYCRACHTPFEYVKQEPQPEP